MTSDLDRNEEATPFEHKGDSKTWSYTCRCLRCRWEQWWNEGDNFVIGMPDEDDPSGDFSIYFNKRELWAGWVHPNG